MRILLDEDSSRTALVSILQKDGHDVESCQTARLEGEPDAVQLTRAISEARVFFTRNHDDFEDLHDLILEARGHHPGILVVRQDNDPRRDMTPRGIAIALKKLAASGLSLADQFQVLNHWR